ncbi:hypothetical protein FB451DRAFT_1411675 [Mycena latifolia]|nr:hypothetical protein FB451DRAFT_1411675 [Mycena latifolia]
MKAIASCLLLAPVLVAAIPTPDFPVTVLLNIGDEGFPFTQQSLSAAGTQGDATIYHVSLGGPVPDPFGSMSGHPFVYGYDCKFADTSAAECVRHVNTAVETVTLPVEAIATLTASGDPPSPSVSGLSTFPHDPRFIRFRAFHTLICDCNRHRSPGRDQL